MTLPAPLEEIAAFLETLSEDERRDALVAHAEGAGAWEPRQGERFEREDIRHDQRECTDQVGIHLRLEEGGTCAFRISLGPRVQTLTRALSAILAQGLEGAGAQQVLAVPGTLIPRLVGAELVRLRARSVYYILRRMQEIVREAA
ncbi:MAG: Fe-S metabolism protein SufE [Verrucomicrobiales bacterium]